MNDPASTRPTSSATPQAPPASCPSCRSSSIITTAKKADDDSYWRCTTCGEIWNVKRSVTGSYGGGRRWR
jgi:predicted Zn finger-like uncharacterized protein